MYKKGERIELISMEDDPNPIRAGSQGTVVSCFESTCGRRKMWNVDVDWDSGRTLSLCIPPDRAKRI